MKYRDYFTAHFKVPLIAWDTRIEISNLDHEYLIRTRNDRYVRGFYLEWKFLGLYIEKEYKNPREAN